VVCLLNARGLMPSDLGLVQAMFPLSIVEFEVGKMQVRTVRMLVGGLRTMPDLAPVVCLQAPVGVILHMIDSGGAVFT
jgi:hypothetical protein